MSKLLVIGGGAAGFFSAIIAASKYPFLDITIVEQQKKVLSKVKISGGGRCNVTTGISDPNDLAKNYPRGGEFLRQPFHKFGSCDMQRWLSQRGVHLKTEADGRVFPVSNQSQTIIDCFLKECNKLGISILTKQKVFRLEHQKNHFLITTNQEKWIADYLIIASGSSSLMWKQLESLGHEIVAPVPSLFTFHCRDVVFSNLQGVTISNVEIAIRGMDLQSSGPLLITHWGLSGPSVLKLSAFGARWMHKMNYDFDVLIDFLPGWTDEDFQRWIVAQGRKKPKNANIDLPRRFWQRVLDCIEFPDRFWSEIGKKDKNQLWGVLKKYRVHVSGKSRFKEEFVTAGGVDLDSVDQKTCESKICPKLFLCGEVLNIDAVTGGFNFQAAWTTAWMVGQNVAE